MGVCGCRVVTDHTHINCTTVEWTGASHFFNVQINGQWSTSPLVSCGKPEVQNFTGNATTNANSRGGEVVIIHGANFGANSSTLDSVTYGPGGTEYAAKRCQYGDRPHRELVCEMVPGIGDNHAWIVTVDGQSSQASAARTGYEPPTLTGGIVHEDSPVALTSPTEGGQPYVLNGSGFGLNVENTYIQIMFDGTAIEIAGGVTKVYNGDSTLSYATETDAGYQEHIEFEMPELTNDVHEKEAKVVITHAAYPGITAESQTFTVRYGDPSITDLQSNGGTIVLDGENFGLMGYINMTLTDSNNTGTAVGSYIYASTDDVVSLWTHDMIKFDASGSQGYLRIHVGEKVSNRRDFSSQNPVLVTTDSNYLPSNPYRTEGVDANGDSYSLNVLGLYLGTVESSLSVYIGGVRCPIQSGSLAEVDSSSVAGFDDSSSAETLRSVTCTVPAGTGAENRVEIYRSGLSTFAEDESEYVYLQYAPPEVTAFSPHNVSTLGENVTIYGDNFGSTSAAGIFKVWYGSTKLEVIDEERSFSHTSLMFRMPRGEGKPKPLTITVDGQSTVLTTDGSRRLGVGVEVGGEVDTVGLGRRRLSSSTSISYHSPKITGISPTEIPTTGGSVTVTGKHFGRPGSSSANVLDEDGNVVPDILAVVAAADEDLHTWMVINVSSGYGKRLLHVNVSGQTANSNMDYIVPVISSLDPDTGPTSGGQNLTLTGSNFGTGALGSFSLRVGDYQYTEGSSSSAIEVLEFSHERIVFTSPEGQSSVSLDVNLTVGGQAANKVSYTFDAPQLHYVADAITSSGGTTTTYTPLLEATSKYTNMTYTPTCERSSEEGCGLTTAGGFTVALVGSNFGLSDAGVQVVYLNGAVLELTVESHTLAYVTIPEGTGVNLPMIFGIKSRGGSGVLNSNRLDFAYDPPYISYVSPNTPNADGDTIRIYGNNFGASQATAGHIAVSIGGEPCVGVSASDDDGGVSAGIWQIASGEAYLWCMSARLRVGRQSVEVRVAGQNVSWAADESKIETVCAEGFFGQEAWTVLATSADTVCQECSDDQIACRGVYNETRGAYDDAELILNGAISASSCSALEGCRVYSDPIGPSSIIVTEDDDNSPGSTRGNCSVVTMTNEYCMPCPIGSACPPKVIYPVEPVSEIGYWRLSLPYDGSLDVCDDRDSRTHCYSVVPCAPEEACVGNNECQKGYTGERCALCCDYAHQ